MLKIGMTCYPTIGGSGILACALGEVLARKGHEVHFISYEQPVRLAIDLPFHRVVINEYELFRYPDYTLPLSVKLAEVSREYGLDILHVHYAVPHATAALLARAMLPAERQPRIVTTLHGTDTTLLARDAGYAPAIRYALTQSDAVTAVSSFLCTETRQVLHLERPVDVIYNFFVPQKPRRSRAEVRRELGIGEEAMILHSSNLRSTKRIDVLLETAARLRHPYKLVILAGGDFAPYAAQAQRLGVNYVVRQTVNDVEDYVNAADVALVTSDSESFCLTILEAMCFACPAVATRVGGIPEVVEHDVTGLLAPRGDTDALAAAVDSLLIDPPRRARFGAAALARSQRFTADVVVPQYEALYERVLSIKASG